MFEMRWALAQTSLFRRHTELLNYVKPLYEIIKNERNLIKNP